VHRLAVISTLTLIACATSPPPTPRTLSPVAPPPPVDVTADVTVTPLTRDDLLRVVGVRRLRAIEPAYVVLRARITARAPEIPLDINVTIEPASPSSANAALPTVEHTLLALSELTGERPRDHVHRYLRTSDAPWPAHVLTFGILTILTLRIDREVTPPSDAEVRAVAPRAIALAEALRGTCPRAGACERLFVIRCERHDVNPEVYLADVLLRIQDHPNNELADLLPHRWKEARGSGFTVERIVTPAGAA
jgi:hypothetical protein